MSMYIITLVATNFVTKYFHNSKVLHEVLSFIGPIDNRGYIRCLVSLVLSLLIWAD